MSTTLTRILSDIPHLSPAARERLMQYATHGRDVYAYVVAGERWIIWVEPRHPAYEGRWSVAALNDYCAGIHSTDPEQLCMCEPCQERRWSGAQLRAAAGGDA